MNATLDLIPKNTLEQHDLRKIETLVINPSIDINKIAHRHSDEVPWAIRRLMATIGVTRESESSLISYLFFEQEYCKELIDAGFNDGIAQQRELRAFLDINQTKIRQKHAHYDLRKR